MYRGLHFCKKASSFSKRRSKALPEIKMHVSLSAGLQGDTGSAGRFGPKGAKGFPGSPATSAPTGKKGLAGVPGPKGISGQKRKLLDSIFQIEQLL